ncbi:MAG: transposase [Oscillospiraceae bacterium]
MTAEHSYTSNTFRKLLLSNQVTQSFSNPGKPIDNAVAESFFALLKREELYRRNYRSEREFRESAKSYIRFYNAERPHRANRYKSPEQFEAEYSQSIDNLDKLVQN